ncbi:MAG: hypothetical protein ACI9A1_001530, partial [Lentimonas sp.]
LRRLRKFRLDRFSKRPRCESSGAFLRALIWIVGVIII